MKKIVVILIVLILAYTCLWYYNVEKAKDTIVRHIQAWEIEDKGYRLQYARLGVGGYPFSYKVKLHQQKFNWHAGQATSLQSSLEGVLELGTYLWGTHYWVENDGEWHVPNSQGTSAQLIISGLNKFDIEVDNPNRMNAFIHPFATLPKELYQGEMTLEKLWKNVNVADFDLGNFMITDTSNHPENILSTNKASFKFSKKKEKDGLVKMDYELVLKDLEGLDNVQPYFHRNLKTFFEEIDHTLPFMTSPMVINPGKVNLKLSGEANLPLEDFSLERLLDLPKLSFIVKNFEFSSKFGDSFLKTNFLIEPKEKEEKSIHFDFIVGSEINEEGYKNLVNQFIQLLHNEEKKEKNLQDLLQCCEEDLKKIIPRYDLFGLNEINLNLDVDTAKEGESKIYKIDLKKLDYTTKLWGIQSKGNMSLDGVPRGKYQLHWINYTAMIEDLTNYYNRLYPLIARLSDKNEPVDLPSSITPKMLTHVIDFLRYISDNPDDNGKDLDITIDFENIQEVRIGLRSFVEVVAAEKKLETSLSEELKLQKKSTQTPAERKPEP